MRIPVSQFLFARPPEHEINLKFIQERGALRLRTPGSVETGDPWPQQVAADALRAVAVQ